MRKDKELSDSNSCLSKARKDELIFVLLERDMATPETIRFWCEKRIELGKNTASDEQILQALELAREIERLGRA